MMWALRICVLSTAALMGAGSVWAGPPTSSSNEAAQLAPGAAAPAGATKAKALDPKHNPTRALDPRTRGQYRAFFFGASHLRIPNLVLSTFLRSYSNALCTKGPSARARAMGVNRSDGCNFGLRAGYRRVKNQRGLDLELGYSRLAMPKSNWVANNEQIPAADYLEISFHAVSVAVGLWRDIPLSRRSTRWSWRFGGQLGLAWMMGSAHRTKLGAQPGSCNFDTLGDLSLCRPYRPLEFNEGSRNARAFAHCSAKDGCDPRDLQRAGREEIGAIPPILPWFNLWTGPGYAIDRATRIDARFSVGIGLGIGLGIERRLGR